MTRTNLIDQANEMVSLHPGLTYICANDGIIFEGIYWLNHTYDDVPLCDDFTVKISIPWNYPFGLPTIWETSGKIPVDGSFQHFLKASDNALCLGAICDLLSLLEQNPTISSFVDQVLPSYLYEATYYYKYGTLPTYGDRAHGLDGTIQAYKDRYDAQDDKLLLILLRMLMGINPCRGHLPCPCGSDQKFRNCHGRQVLKDINSRYYNLYCYDAYEIIKYYFEKRKTDM